MATGVVYNNLNDLLNAISLKVYENTTFAVKADDIQQSLKDVAESLWAQSNPDLSPYFKKDGSVAMTGPINMNGQGLGVVDHVAFTGAGSLNRVLSATPHVELSGEFWTVRSTVSTDNDRRIVDKEYVDVSINDVTVNVLSLISNYLNLSGGTMGGDINFQGIFGLLAVRSIGFPSSESIVYDFNVHNVNLNGDFRYPMTLGIWSDSKTIANKEYVDSKTVRGLWSVTPSISAGPVGETVSIGANTGVYTVVDKVVTCNITTTLTIGNPSNTGNTLVDFTLPPVPVSIDVYPTNRTSVQITANSYNQSVTDTTPVVVYQGTVLASNPNGVRFYVHKNAKSSNIFLSLTVTYVTN